MERYLERVEDLSLSFFYLGQHEFNGGEEGAVAPAIRVEEEGDAGVAL